MTVAQGFKADNNYEQSRHSRIQKAAEGELDTLPSARIGDKSIARITRFGSVGSIVRVLFGGQLTQTNTNEHGGEHGR